jgi:hypothetical protein
MRYFRYLALLSIFLLPSTAFSHAQVAFGVGVGPGYVGPAPVCEYGYYGYAPYACAPYGYYGPDYFVGGVFIGAGPWFHGFRGYGYGRPGIAFRGGYGYRGYAAPVVRGGYAGGFRGGYAAGGRTFASGGGFHGGAVRGGGGYHGGGGRR